MATGTYIKGVGIFYPRELETIKKKEDVPLQPVFEAFTNALESIATLRDIYSMHENGKIEIELHLAKTLFSKDIAKYDFQKIVITDTGIGFDNNEFERFINLRDNRKNYSNKGTGRVQYLHSFDKTKIESVYRDKDSSTGFSIRRLTLSKSKPFMDNNAIIRLDGTEDVTADSSHTTVTFETVLVPKESDYFVELTAKEIKEELIRHYLAGFCEKRDELPQIKIKTFIDNAIESEEGIESEDIPKPDKEEPIEIHYSKVVNNSIERSPEKETFMLRSFIIPQEELDKNGLKLISKGEVAKEIGLENLLPTDQINGNRYLFLLSGKYIDERDSDTRGNINIFKKKDFKKNNADKLFSDEEILWEDIEDRANETIVSLYQIIAEKSKEKEKSIKELEEMFLLNPATIKALQNKIHIGDSDDTILRKIYEADAKAVANKDAEIKKQIKELEQLEPNNKDYQEKLTAKVNEFVKAIPLQNRTALTQYIARRKMVLDLFDRILGKQIEKLKTGGRIDEDLLHNLIFQQASDQPESSDLWLINEEFIYYKGTSESHLGTLKVDGEKLIKEKLTEEEEAYRLKQSGDARMRRTDILLFPKEGKCIIIELKAPDANVSDHLNQINKYASLINNLSKDEFNIHTFYGYLIGESIDIDDIQDNDSDFKSAHELNYIFRPYKRIIGKFGKDDGALYTEVIKYSTLLERAQLRNKIFIEKLTGKIQ
jgi:hypothetical protein